MAKKTPKSSDGAEKPKPKRSKASPKKSGAKGKSAPVSKPSPKKAVSKTSAVEKYRDIDRLSVSALIVSRFVNEPKGISPDQLKRHLMSRFEESIDANLRDLQRQKKVEIKGDQLSLSSVIDLVDMMVCLALQSGIAMAESDVITSVHEIDKTVRDQAVRDSLENLSKREGKCVEALPGKFYKRNCTKPCPCD